MTSSASTSVFGQEVTFTATITPAGGASPSTGTVTFYDGDVLLGTGTLLSPGVWTFSTGSLTVGDHPDITAAVQWRRWIPEQHLARFSAGCHPGVQSIDRDRRTQPGVSLAVRSYSPRP